MLGNLRSELQTQICGWMLCKIPKQERGLRDSNKASSVLIDVQKMSISVYKAVIGWTMIGRRPFKRFIPSLLTRHLLPSWFQDTAVQWHQATGLYRAMR